VTTSHHRHSHAPLRRSSTPAKILTTGLAAATCVGIIGVIGMRTIDSNAAASAETAPAAQPPATPSEEVASTGGLTREQLDAYAASLVAEKQRLDAYRAKLIRTAHRLRAMAATSATPSVAAPAATARRTTTSRSSAPRTSRPSTVQQPTPTVAKPKVAKPAAAPAPAQKPAAGSGGGSATKSS
jgi:hypothetical protein